MPLAKLGSFGYYRPGTSFNSESHAVDHDSSSCGHANASPDPRDLRANLLSGEFNQEPPVGGLADGH
jgi:hypothetical protein